MVKSSNVGLFLAVTLLASACSSKTAVTPAPPLAEGDDDSSGVDAGPEPAKLVVFVTSTLYNGGFGGLSQADALCQARAAAANLSGHFRAWLSDPTGSPSTRFTHPTESYVLVDGTLVAAGWAGLTSGQLAHAIDETELGMSPPDASLGDGGVADDDAGAGVLAASNGGPSAWSDTAADGTFDVDGFACNEWMAGTMQSGDFGDPTATDASWTVAGRVKPGYCATAMASLYCVQQ